MLCLSEKQSEEANIVAQLLPCDVLTVVLFAAV